MIQIGNPYSRESLLAAAEKVNWIVTKAVHDLTLDDFYSRYNKQWSVSDTVQHLSKSAQPVTFLLRCPKLYLWIKYGRMDERPSRRFDQMVALYHKALARGVPPDKYAPVLYEVPYAEEDAERFQKQDQRKWRRTSSAFQKAASKWDDYQMDRYQLPHPVLGIITAREMIMYTIFHTQQHIESALKRVYENAAAEV
jgi:hypothetical protein